MLELLYLKNWNSIDGLGALIITPTRELAYQIYEVLNKVGKHHSFSAGLVIGGKDLKFEWKRIRCNILICTPGRLLQHMTENPDFSVENLQMLVLDEADLCLSLGFEDAMNDILGELPTERQTLLFSATQTRNLENLVRAGCKNPIFCSVHEFSKTVTPKTLQESYVVYSESEKINFLFSFLRHHKKKKILVFVSTCKQVKFIFDLFTHLKPGLTVMALHGNMNQLRRMAVFDEFCNKKRAVLFATNVASRGLDIPSVDWVLQLDCPEDIKTYIHRVGRTARHTSTGEALLVLTPSQEEPMVNTLKANNIPIEKIIVNARELIDIRAAVESNLSKFTGLKDEAERAFKNYIKNFCYNFMKNKKVFDVTSLDLDAYARSLGLTVTPKYSFFKRFLLKNSLKMKNDTSATDLKASGKRIKNTAKTSSLGVTEDDDSEDEFLHRSESQPVKTDGNPEDILKDYSLYINPSKEVLSKSYIANKLQKKNVELNKRVVFDDEGNLLKLNKNEEDSLEGIKPGISLVERQQFLKAQDVEDKKQNTLRIKEMHRLEKEKLKALKQKLKNKVDDEDMLEERDEDYDDDDEDDENEDSSFTNQIINDLPDPDKIYDNKSGSSSSSDSDSEEEEEQFDESSIELNKKKRKDKKEVIEEVAIKNKNRDKVNEGNSTENMEKKTKSKQNFSGKRKAKEEAKAAKKAKLSAENDFGSISCSEKESLALYLLQNT
ncbi:putative ATP-dependent RNA helicase DDX10 [Armadillidium nasatum]|uniref:ATP-dependent RNA helicase n=1 Tax=Armadillidium nasatum TaxID=96803 RepID=A0A5N5SZW7_9CRUS|nr:putative ATP-dependent RNA helicase DDX10 [Armadillidium nasatum]